MLQKFLCFKRTSYHRLDEYSINTPSFLIKWNSHFYITENNFTTNTCLTSVSNEFNHISNSNIYMYHANHIKSWSTVIHWWMNFSSHTLTVFLPKHSDVRSCHHLDRQSHFVVVQRLLLARPVWKQNQTEIVNITCFIPVNQNKIWFVLIRAVRVIPL